MSKNLRRELLTKWLIKNDSFGYSNLHLAKIFLTDYPDINISANRVSKDIAEIKETVGKRVIKPIVSYKVVLPPKASTNPSSVNTTISSPIGWVTSTTYDPKNTLIIGDLHAPFIIRGALDFCLEQQKKYNCGRVIFMGDIADQHSISYHEKNPDGLSQTEEYNLALLLLNDWYQAFPEVSSLLGNHDLLIHRKMQSAGLSTRYLKDWNSIFNAPKGWKFEYDFVENNVRYTHGGAGGDALKMATDSRISTVQGHLHSKAYVQYAVSMKDAIFGMQVGCMIDHKAYAFEYSKPFPKKPVISCGIILDKGRVPFNVLMDL